MLALAEPRAQPLLAARVEERRRLPPLERAHRVVDGDGAQALEVLLERRHHVGLLRDDLGVPGLELGVALGELRREAAQVGHRRALRRALHHQLLQARGRRGQPRVARAHDGLPLHDVQAEVALVVEERAHERRRRVRLGARLLRRRELRRHLELVRRHRRGHRLGRRARERRSREEEDGTVARVARRQAVLAQRTVLLQLQTVEQQDLQRVRHASRRLERRLQAPDRGVRARHWDMKREARLGLLHDDGGRFSRRHDRRPGARCPRGAAAKEGRRGTTRPGYVGG